MSNKTRLQTNNINLQDLIDKANNLPDAGSGRVDTSDATASAGDILSGKTAYVNGQKITGTIAFQPAKIVTPGIVNQTAVPSGYYTNGDIIVEGDSNLIAENIKSGTSIFGVTGTYEGSGGGSSGDTGVEDALVTRTLTTYTNDRVTTIGSWAFVSCKSLTTISFPACTTIGIYAFSSCTALTTASFPKCTTIGMYAFYYCTSLTTISFPSCTSIEADAFASCRSLTTASFPSCTTIGMYAFASCTSLTTISFPSCTTIGSYAFNRCSALTTASFPKCTTIGNSAFYYCSKLTTVSFPACTTIGSNAFRYCTSLTTVSFPACTSIGTFAFGSCSGLTSIYLLGNSLCSLANSNAFLNTSIWSDKGSIFVPSSLVASYKSATNWAFFSNRIFAG